MKENRIPTAEALASPWDYFDDPAALLSTGALSNRQKQEALRSWELDARLRMKATEENMAGGPDNELREVSRCLRRLESSLS
jgi:hypothetical protein